MKKYSSIKKFSKKAVDWAKVLTGTLGVVFGGNQVIAGTKTISNDYKTPQQIQSDAETFNANTLIMGYQPLPPKFNVLMHNGNEPIYYFIGSSYSEREKELVKEVLNYYETAFKTINSKYRFKEVSSAEGIFRTTIGQSVINFQKIKTNEFSGASLNYYSLLSPTYSNGSTILFNSELSLNEYTKLNDGTERQFYQTIFEEVGHTFGLGDVYFNKPHHPILFGLNNTTNIVHTNTFMQNYTFLRAGVSEFTPLDYAMNQALYNTSHLDGTHSPQYVKNLIKEYSNTYYRGKLNYLITAIKQEENSGLHMQQPFSNLEGKTIEIAKLEGNVDEFRLKNLTHQIFVGKDGVLTHKVYDDKQKLVDEGVFEYVVIDDVIIVQNAFFASGIQPGVAVRNNVGGGAYSDYAIVNTNFGPKMVNFLTVNRLIEYSQKTQMYLANNFKGLSAHEPRAEMIKEKISEVYYNNKEAQRINVASGNKNFVIILPEDKTLKGLENQAKKNRNKNKNFGF